MVSSSPSVIREWESRVGAEYCSAALSAELLHWLILLGVSPDTLRDCHQIVSDELHHAQLSREVALAAGGNAESVKLAGRRMSIPHGHGSSPLERALLFATDFFCCGETVARPLFRAMLANAQQPVATNAIATIVRDEARHSAFGWQLLDELLERADDSLRARLRDQVPGFLARLRTVYGEGDSTQASRPLDDLERAWGLLERSRYAQITEDCIATTLQPRFRARSLA